MKTVASVPIPHLKALLPLLAILCSFFLLPSCYSVRFINANGAYIPDPTNTKDDFYKGMHVVELDTNVKLGLLDTDLTGIESCPSGGFYAFEYRVTLGGAIKSGLSFNKKRKIQIKYVCLKEEN